MYFWNFFASFLGFFFTGCSEETVYNGPPDSSFSTRAGLDDTSDSPLPTPLSSLSIIGDERGEIFYPSEPRWYFYDDNGTIEPARSIEFSLILGAPEFPKALERIDGYHGQYIDVSRSNRDDWLSGLELILHRSHRGDEETWIGLGGRGMVTKLTFYHFQSVAGIFFLASELASRPVNANFNVSDEIQSRVCELYWDEFSLELISAHPDSFLDNCHHMSPSERGGPLKIAPWANLNFACRPSMRRPEMNRLILEHRICRQMISNGSTFVDFQTRAIVLSRTDLHLDARLAMLYSVPPQKLREGIQIWYQDDKAIGVGVYRDWLTKTMNLVMEGRNFFIVNQDDGCYGVIDDAYIEGGKGWQFEAVGRRIGLMMVESIPLGFQLNWPLLAVLTGVRGGGSYSQWTVDDLVHFDTILHQSYSAILQCKIDHNCGDFELYFETPDGFGLERAVNGERVVAGDYPEGVTDSNVDEFVNLRIRYIMFERSRIGLSEIQTGFRHLIDLNIFNHFIDPNELGKILRGSSKIDARNIRSRIFISGIPSDRVSEWFFEFIEDGERVMQLVHFVTGLRAVPVGGSIPRMTVTLVPYDSSRPMPRAHLCAQLMELPLYRSREELRDRLSEALVQTDLGIL